jgi:hypothetical protein
MSIAALAVSRAAPGFIGAGAFMLAIAVFAVSFGIAAEAFSGLVARENRWRRDEARCGSCGTVKSPVASIWVCQTCDRIEC